MADWNLYAKKINIDGSTNKERQINSTIQSILNDFEYSPSCKDVYFNNETEITKILITEDGSTTSDIVNDIKTFVLKPYEKRNVGDVITWDNEKWLIVESEMVDEIYLRGHIQKANNTLKYYDRSNESTVLYEIPCIVESKVNLYSMGVDNAKILSIPDSVIVVKVSNNEITNKIKRNDVYKLGDYDNYKVVDINRVIQQGLIILKMEWDEKEQEVPIHNYSISILNGDTASLSQGETLQLNIQVTDNGNIITSPLPISYSSDNESLLTVDENGLVTAVGAGGNAIITATYEELSVSISISIKIETQNNYTVDIVTSGVLKTNQSITATALFKNNGIVIDDTALSWWVLADDDISPTSLVTITYDDNVCNIKAGNSTGYVRLHVNGVNCQGSIRLQISSLW